MKPRDLEEGILLLKQLSLIKHSVSNTYSSFDDAGKYVACNELINDLEKIVIFEIDKLYTPMHDM